MIKEFDYPDRSCWQLVILNVDLDYYLRFIKKFEEVTRPKEKKVSFWHDTIAEFIIEKYFNNKVIVEYSEGIVIVKFMEASDDLLKQELKVIAEFLDNETA